MTLHKKLLIIGSLSVSIGLAGTMPTIYYWTQNRVAANPQAFVPAPQPKPGPALVTGKPQRLSVDTLNLNLAVVDGVYNASNGQWTLSNDKAHYALLSSLTNNEQGNTLIYGHYRPEVFARLHKIQPGAEATVLTDNGYRFVYVYRSTHSVNPADTSIFGYQGLPMLTLQTCSGAWFQNRQMYSFEFVRYEKV